MRKGDFASLANCLSITSTPTLTLNLYMNSLCGSYAKENAVCGLSKMQQHPLFLTNIEIKMTNNIVETH